MGNSIGAINIPDSANAVLLPIKATIAHNPKNWCVETCLACKNMYYNNGKPAILNKYTE